MTTLQIIEKKIKSLSSDQLKKVKNYIETLPQIKSTRRRGKLKKDIFDEYYGIYNYSKVKIEKELNKIRLERNRNIEIPN